LGSPNIVALLSYFFFFADALISTGLAIAHAARQGRLLLKLASPRLAVKFMEVVANNRQQILKGKLSTFETNRDFSFSPWGELSV
jgi:hypothetical protein